MRRSQTMQEQMVKRKRRNSRARRRNKMKLRVMGVLALIAAILISLIPMPAMAEDPDLWIEDFRCPPAVGGEVTLGRYIGNSTSIVIPAHVTLDGNQYKVILGRKFSEVFADNTTLEEIDLSNLDLSETKDMTSMFSGCTKLKTVKFGSNALENVTSMEGTFEDCAALEMIELPNGTLEHVESFANTFSGCSSLTKLDLPAANVKTVTDMSGMFNGCTLLRNVNLARIDTSNVTSMVDMFKNCETVESLDLSMFNTQNVTSMTGMFSGCFSLSTLDWGDEFNSSKVTAISDMFKDCKSFTTLDLSKFDLSSVKSSPTGMLDGIRAKYIKTPINVKKRANISLPANRYLDADDKEYLTLPEGSPDSDKSITLTGRTHVESVEIRDHDKTVELTVGGEYQLEAVITPNPETDESVDAKITWESSDGSIVQVDSETGKLTALKATEGENVTITCTTRDGGFQSTREVKVTNEIIDASGVTLPITKKKLKVGENLSLSATVLPDNASDKSVQWSSDARDKVSVDENGLVTAHKASKDPVIITATTTNGKVAKCEITAVDEYTVKLSDERGDASNRSLSTMAIDKELKSDLNLTVSEIDSVKIRDLLEQREGFNVKDASYFKVSKVTDENGVEANDFGRITLTLAMPGRLMNKGLTPRLYRYAPAEDGLIFVQSIAAQLGNEYKVEAFSFDITDATDDAQYAIVLETKIGYNMYVNDERSVNPQDASAAVTNMSSDLFFFVQDKEKPAIEVLIDQNQNLSSYKTREYYEMFISSDSAGKNKVDDFGICYITLTLPKEMDYTKGDIKVVSMQQDGNQMALDTAFAPEFKTDAKGIQYITIRTTHFSEYALLYLENQQQPGAGTSSTTGTTTGQTTGTNTGASTGNTQGTGASTGNTQGTGASTGNTQTTNTGASSGNTQGTNTATGATSGSTSAGVTPTSQTHSNSADMPTTGGSGKLPLYRNMGVILLALAGATMLIASKVI